MTYLKFLDPDQSGSVSGKKNADLDTETKKIWNHEDPNPNSQPCCHKISSNCHIIGPLPPCITYEW